ncbi:MAG: branched-chain amino acid ABC transporter permease [Halanaeroarchaeum sp.]
MIDTSDAEGTRNRDAIRESLSLSLYDRLKVPVGLLVLVLVLRPVVSSNLLLGYGQAATTMLIWMLFAAGFNLLLGYTGVLSFGHAMFFGTGMYAVAIGLAKFDVPFLAGAVIALVLAGCFAYLIGRLIVDKGEIYFAMLTIAFGEAFYFVVNQDPWGLTGGSNGLSQGTMPSWIMTYRGDKFLSLAGVYVDWYWAVAAAFLVAMLVLWQVVRSPFGRTLVSIRENPELARAMGVDVARYKVSAFTLSAVFAAAAGVLLEINDQGAVIHTFHWSVGGQVVFMSILGGMNYFAGPLAGAFVWQFVSNYLSAFQTLALPMATYDVNDLMVHWRFLLGLLFVVIIIVSPREGVWGFLHRAGAAIRTAVEEVRE